MRVNQASLTIERPSRENAMRNVSFVPVFATLFLIVTANVAGAEQFGTADEAKAMLDRAITALKSDQAAALRAFTDANNKLFHDRDLYVSCFNTSDGKFTAFPGSGMIDRKSTRLNSSH